MISIRQKKLSYSPKRLTCVGSISQILNASNTLIGASCNGTYYRDNHIRNLLKAYSIGKGKLKKRDEPKCYYCESQGEAMLKLEVEHYRPKERVSAKDLALGQVHNGYYWLGNEWSNLLLACRACNGGSAKGTRFPILNNPNRVNHGAPVTAAMALNRRMCRLDLAPLLSEDPVILNPEYDTPEDHLTFLPNGQIVERNSSPRGQQTIQILQLYRDPLLTARSKIVNEFIDDAKIYMEARRQGMLTTDGDLQIALVLICRKIIKRQQVNVSYTLWGRFINTEIESVIISKLPLAYRQIFRNAYQFAIATS